MKEKLKKLNLEYYIYNSNENQLVDISKIAYRGCKDFAFTTSV